MSQPFEPNHPEHESDAAPAPSWPPGMDATPADPAESTVPASADADDAPLADSPIVPGGNWPEEPAHDPEPTGSWPPGIDAAPTEDPAPLADSPIVPGGNWPEEPAHDPEPAGSWPPGIDAAPAEEDEPTPFLEPDPEPAPAASWPPEMDAPEVEVEAPAPFPVPEPEPAASAPVDHGFEPPVAPEPVAVEPVVAEPFPVEESLHLETMPVEAVAFEAPPEPAHDAATPIPVDAPWYATQGGAAASDLAPAASRPDDEQDASAAVLEPPAGAGGEPATTPAAARRGPFGLALPSLALPSLPRPNMPGGAGARRLVPLAALALLGGGFLVLRSSGSDEPATPVAAKPAAKAPATPGAGVRGATARGVVVSAPGGFELTAPTGYRATRNGPLVTLAAPDRRRAYAVSGAPGETASPRSVADDLVAGYRARYRLAAVTVRRGAPGQVRVVARGTRRGSRSTQRILAVVFRPRGAQRGVYVVQRFTSAPLSRRGTARRDAEFKSLALSVRPRAEFARYLAAVNRICADTPSLKSLSRPRNPGEVVTLLDRLARLGDQEVAKVATVQAPAELSYVRSQLLGYQRQALAEMRSLSSGLKAAGDDRAKMAEISRARLPRIARIVRESQPKLQSLGLASCAARTSA